MAASSAVLIKEKFGVDPTLRTGSRGQFLLEVDGQARLERKGGVIAFLMRKPWPSEASVIAAIESAKPA